VFDTVQGCIYIIYKASLSPNGRTAGGGDFIRSMATDMHATTVRSSVSHVVRVKKEVTPEKKTVAKQCLVNIRD
jgi:hypothetical protein